MKVKVQMLVYEGQNKDDCTISDDINRVLNEWKITTDNLIDIKFNTHEDILNNRDNDIDGYITKTAILIIYKEA